MLIIPVKEGENIDRALKRFKRKFDKTGAMKNLRARQAFIKPSVKNRDKIKKAAYVQNLKRSRKYIISIFFYLKVLNFITVKTLNVFFQFF